LVSDQGAGTALYGVVIEAGGVTFATPVTIVLTWPDADNDGIVDGTQILETDLVLTKDGVVMAGIQDPAANTYSLQVSSLSHFCLVFIDKQGPQSGNLVTAPFPVPVNTPVTLMATVSDAQTGATPIGAAEYALDGGPLVAMAPADGAFDQVSEVVIAPLAPFAQAGVHTIQVRGWDAMKNVAGPAETLLLPVYDPSGGFVTGGGWINSPPGAYLPGLGETAGLTGKATFGFVAKYQKGANVPDGNTEFQFKARNLNFKSTPTNGWSWRGRGRSSRAGALLTASSVNSKSPSPSCLRPSTGRSPAAAGRTGSASRSGTKTAVRFSTTTKLARTTPRVWRALARLFKAGAW
jgi:hypothetical protein